MNMLEKKLQENKAIVDDALCALFADYNTTKSKVAEAMQYAVLGGGKRIRAFLVRQFAEVFGGTVEAALPFAVAVELGHAASLIHDDLPCMDDGAVRHSKPSCHVAYGEAVAVLAGDALLALAFEKANANPFVTAEVSRYAVSVLAQKSGACGMCFGQELDISGTCRNVDELVLLYNLKTGASMQASALLGCLSSNKIPDKAEVTKISEYSQKLGLIFQIKDDILDVTKTEQQTGKSSGIDMRNGTKTILSYMTLQEAENQIITLAEEAACLFGDPLLKKLPFYLAQREK